MNKGRIVNTLKTLRPESVWGWIIAVFLFILVLSPVLYMVNSSFVYDENGPRMVRGAEEGAYTFFNWIRVVKSDLAKSIFYEPALNSLAIAVGMTTISLVLGCFFCMACCQNRYSF